VPYQRPQSLSHSTLYILKSAAPVIDGITDPLKRETFVDALDHHFGGGLEGFIFATVGALNHAYEDGVELPAPLRFAPIGHGA
jgi:hypothetical protein